MRPEREVDDRIADWVDGRLVGKDLERFEAELRVNPQLRRDLEAYERTVATVRQALQQPGEPVQLADRVLAAIAAGAQPKPRQPVVLRWRPWLWSLATAAALLVVALLVDAWCGKPEADLRVQADLDRVPANAPAGTAGTEGKDQIPPRTGPGDTMPQEDLDAQKARAGKVVEVQRDAAAGGPTSAPTAPAAPAGRSGEPAGAPAPGAAAGPGSPPLGGARAQDRETGSRGADEHRVVQPTAPATVRQGLGEELPPAAEGEAAKVEQQQAKDAVPPQVPLELLPLVVLQGPAPASADQFSRRLRERAGRAAGGAERDKDASKGLNQRTKGDLGQRIDEFLTAQVAQLGAPPSRDSAKDKKATADRGEVVPAAPGWVAVADLRLHAIDRSGAADPAAAVSATGAAPEPRWIERDWLVEGSREDVAALLQRLATFARASEMQVLTGETTAAPPATEAVRDAVVAPAERLVLRFRLQAR